MGCAIVEEKRVLQVVQEYDSDLQNSELVQVNPNNLLPPRERRQKIIRIIHIKISRL